MSVQAEEACKSTTASEVVMFGVGDMVCSFDINADTFSFMSGQQTYVVSLSERRPRSVKVSIRMSEEKGSGVAYRCSGSYKQTQWYVVWRSGFSKNTVMGPLLQQANGKIIKSCEK
ncbi:MAG: hypothetical protein WD509_02245 [Candidatus Paceibacterota bacterium]